MNIVYNSFKGSRFSGDQMLSATVIAMLVGPTFSFNVSNKFVVDIASAEVSGPGYVRKTLTNKSVVVSNVSNNAVFFADPPSWPGLNVGSVAACVLFVQHNSDADSQLASAFQISPAHLSQGGLFSVKWDPTGILRLS